MGGLPKPLGPYAVAFADLELRRGKGKMFHEGISGNPNGSTQANGVDSAGAAADVQDAPPMRIFYPTSQTNNNVSSFFNSSSRWIPNVMYAWGYISKVFLATSNTHDLANWVLAGLLHTVVFTGIFIQAHLGGPILPVRGKDEESRFPVVVFSHGMWACRTTYTSFCCDLASHGYVVVALEHLDGSANMASYIDHDQKRQWLKNTYSGIPDTDVRMELRTEQLEKRASEARKAIDVLEFLEKGLLNQSDNMITGKGGLKVNILQGRLDLQHTAIAGHSFGGATAILTSGNDQRIKCCVAMDVWWEPIKEVEIQKLAGKVPVLLVNTEAFEWKKLSEIRATFMRARSDAKEDDGRPLITELRTVKGTQHQDQSDFPLVFPSLMKRIGASGELDPKVMRNVNNKLCLEFLYKHLLPQGTGAPYDVKLDEGVEHLFL